MKYLYSETVNSLIEPVQKVIAHREQRLEEYDYHKLEGVKAMLQEWKKNKNRFLYDVFNGHCVEEIGEVAVKLGPEQKKSLTREFIEKLDSDWNILFPDFEDYQDDARDLVEFLDVNFDMLFENKTKYEYEAPDGTVISENSKISKSFKHFFDNKELVRQVQDKYSTLIQQDKMTGILCASIHPLDFLSSSENNYKWRSCHALNGDYANGNASYMMDECTIIFYLKGADNVKLPRFPDDVLWNDKKWRMLAFVSDEERIIWVGRQYPFASDELRLFVLEYFRKKFEYEFPNWNDKYVTAVDNFPLNEEYIYHPCGSLLPRKLFIRDAKWSTHYNDLLYSSFYTPAYALNDRLSMDSMDIPRITVGHTPICACCGEKKKISSSEFTCKECDVILNPPVCKCCGKTVKSKNDLTWVWMVGSLCDECLEKETYICEKCGSRIRKNHECRYCASPFFNGFDAESITAEDVNTGEVVIDWHTGEHDSVSVIDHSYQQVVDAIAAAGLSNVQMAQSIEEMRETLNRISAEVPEQHVYANIEIPAGSETYQEVLGRMLNYCAAQPPPLNYADNYTMVQNLIH